MIRFVNCSFALQFAHSFFFACQVILFQVPQNQQKKKQKKATTNRENAPTFRRWGGFNCWAKKTFEQTSVTCCVCNEVCLSVCVCVQVDKLNNWQLFGKFYELIISHIILLLDSYCNSSKFALFLLSLLLSSTLRTCTC